MKIVKVLVGMTLSTQKEMCEETASTCSLILMDGAMRLFQSVDSKHPCSPMMLSLIHCFMVLTTFSVLLTTGVWAGASSMVWWSAEPSGGRGMDLYASETEP